jgi:hypothetical protein
VLASLLVLAVVAAIVIGAWWWYRQSRAVTPLPAPAPSRVCTTPTPKIPDRLPKPSQVTVAVANGTTGAGLAVETADDLAVTGFAVSSIGNTDRPVKSGVAQVRYGRGDLASAVVLASFVPGAELVEIDRPNVDVTLWIGPEFDGVADAADVDSVTPPPGEPVCRRQ